MKTNRRSRLISAVVAALPVVAVASLAHGQYRVGDDGHAGDANNRIGSGGYNSSRDATVRPYGQTGNYNNNIVYGNTTGLSYFHGNSGVTDPNEFRGSTSTDASDHFLAVSGPMNYQAQQGKQQQTQAWYSATKLIAPPPDSNLVKTPGGGGLVNAPPISNSPSDTRLGLVNSAPEDTTLPNTPGEFAMPGPVDTSGNASALTASPLYGMRQWSPNDPGDAYYLSRYTNSRPEGANNANKLDDATIARMRQELNGTIVQPDLQQQQQQQQQQPLNSNVNQGTNQGTPGANGGAATNGQGVMGGANLGQSQQQNSSASLGSPQNQSLSNQPLNSSINNQPLAANINNTNSQQGVVQRLLIPPEEQSTQIADLERLYAKNKGQMTGQQANALYNREQAAINNPTEEPLGPDGQPRKSASANAAANAQASAGGAGTPQNLTGTDYAKANQDILEKAANPALPPVVNAPLATGDNHNYVITSLATGIKAKGLSDLMKNAEDQMRQGKFTNALDTYDSAQQVAPNNPFIALGRSFAELGASYYGRAEGDLRRAVMAEPALLAGRYDLKGFLGEDRLKFVVKDLKDILTSEKSERPAFMLAYVSHNVGDDEGATKYLDEAERRIGGRGDPVIGAMREAWGLPKSAPTPQP